MQTKFFDIAITQRIAQIPANAARDHLGLTCRHSNGDGVVMRGIQGAGCRAARPFYQIIGRFCNRAWRDRRQEGQDVGT
jgi:hypothetical protein